MASVLTLHNSELCCENNNLRSAVVKVQQKSVVAKLLKSLIVVSVHVSYGKKRQY